MLPRKERCYYYAVITYAGPDVDDIFETLPDTGDDKDYKKSRGMFERVFCSKSQHRLRGISISSGETGSNSAQLKA